MRNFWRAPVSLLLGALGGSRDPARPPFAVDNRAAFSLANEPAKESLPGGGLVASLARPGGNVTGLSGQATDLAGKRLELLREVVPRLRRLAIMFNVGYPSAVLEMGEVQAATRALGIEVAPSAYAAVAAKAATSTIPIIFAVGDDPVRLGLVASLNRPGGNATGVNYFAAYLGPKRLGLLHELLPRGGLVAALVNPNNPVTNSAIAELRAPAAAVGRTIETFHASNGDEINRAFRAMGERKAAGLIMVPDTSFTSHMIQIVTLATRHAIPAIFHAREWAEAGGLMSYGANLQNAYRQVGAHAARILKGAKPADLPVEQSTKFEFVINLQTAKAFDLEVPPTLSARADEVIE